MLKHLTAILANRDLTDVMKLSADHARARVSQRESLSIDVLLNQCNLSPDLLPQSRDLLVRLGDALGIDPGRLRPSDHFATLFRIPHRDLGAKAAAVLARHQVADPVEVFGFEILHVLETASGKSKWTTQRLTLENPPNNEEQWLDTIMGMNLGQLLQFFAPAMAPARH